MVTAKTQYNLKNAEEYFEEHLAVGDYYDEGQRISGEWIGLGAQRLDLSGKVRAEDFLSLCENQHPATGETLTQRLNTTRTEGGESTANRRIFYDFTFSPPKSVSIAGLLGEDKRIFEAHARAVRSALREFEAFAATRVRAGGAQRDRLTCNLVTALFTHDTSRTLDPHLHTHCIVFNATFDALENCRWATGCWLTRTNKAYKVFLNKVHATLGKIVPGQWLIRVATWFSERDLKQVSARFCGHLSPEYLVPI
jgi:conjugative relaxase-like TrwC/TraI family protein